MLHVSLHNFFCNCVTKGGTGKDHDLTSTVNVNKIANITNYSY